MVHRIAMLSAVLASPAAAIANVPPVETATPYRLVEGSTLTAECLPCGLPPITVPIRGGFRLRKISDDPLWTRYALVDLAFSTPGGTAPPHWGEGSGGHAVGGEVALLQEMRLEVRIDDDAPRVLSAGLIPIGAPLPWIEIDLGEELEPGKIWSYGLHLVAAPWGRVRFSTISGFYSIPPPGTTPPRVSGGDLLAPGGWVVRAQHELTARLGIMPAAPDLGLDAVLGVSRIDPVRPYELRFSVDDDVWSETLGQLRHGDLLGEQGTVDRTLEDMIRLFSPRSDAGDIGLDAVAFGPGLTTLFSVERGFYSERLGVEVSRGDILSDDGTIFRTEAQLLASFGPLAGPEGGFGIDAVHLWHHGEVWFSTETGFEDERLGPVGHGDLLSDTGRVVARNRELLQGFAPLEEPGDLGLDGLWVDTSPFFEDCGTLIQGAECLLFAAESGGVYVLDDHGAFEPGDRVLVTGIVDATCAGVCQEGDGCLERNTVARCPGRCGDLPCGPPVFHRSDANDDGATDISDAIRLLQHFFGPGPPPPCLDAADANDDEKLDISDSILILNHLFLGGPPPPYPGPEPAPCGQDYPGPEDLGCEAYTSCRGMPRRGIVRAHW